MTVAKIKMAEGGPLVSRIALGLWRLADWGLDDRHLLDLIHASLELGLTTFDHADIYGDYACEQLFGRVLRQDPALRDRMELVTKCGIKLVSTQRPDHSIKHYDTSRAHIIASAENSLRNLGTDRIDLLLIHRPDPILDADEVAAAFTALREMGKVLHFGVSNFAPTQFELLASRLGFPLVTNQVELSPMNMEVLHDGTVDLCQKLGISPMAWSPLAGGRLFHDETAQARRLRKSLKMVGELVGGATMDQVALAWILRHPSRIIPVLGTGKVERVRKAAAATALELTREQWFSIWTASAGRPVP
jgi:predicted oxidoreductase